MTTTFAAYEDCDHGNIPGTCPVDDCHNTKDPDDEQPESRSSWQWELFAADDVLLAEFDSLCPNCRTMIYVGEPIEKDPDSGLYTHGVCP